MQLVEQFTGSSELSDDCECYEDDIIQSEDHELETILTRDNMSPTPGSSEANEAEMVDLTAVTLESKSSSRADMTLESENQCSLTITTLSGTVHLSTSNGGSTRYDKAQIVTQPSTSQDGTPGTVTQPSTSYDGAPRTVTQPSTSHDGAPRIVTQSSTSQDGAPRTVTQPSTSHDGAPGTVAQPSTSHDEAPQTSTQSSTSPSYVTDKLGQQHFKIPHTGPAAVFVRAARFHSSTIQSHLNNLKPMVDAAVSEGKTVIISIADGGPDWITASLLNMLFYMRLWRDCNLELLVITSFAARYSAYNPIEHLWSPLSKKLNSVRVKAVDGDERHPPCRISALSDAERREEEAKVFDRAVSDLCEGYWKGASFDGCEVRAVKVPCVASESSFYSDHDFVSSFLRVPLREVYTSKYSQILTEYKFTLNHVDRRCNELIFSKYSKSN